MWDRNEFPHLALVNLIIRYLLMVTPHMPILLQDPTIFEAHAQA
jgi:hypothetical protein